MPAWNAVILLCRILELNQELSQSCSSEKSSPSPCLLTVLTIEQVAHRFSAGLVRAIRSLSFVSIHATLFRRLSGFWVAACRTAVGKAGFIRLQLKLFRADGTNFDRKSHSKSMIQRPWGGISTSFILARQAGAYREYMRSILLPQEVTSSAMPAN